MKATLLAQSVDKHFSYLDALRGIAILGVLLVHSALCSKQSGLSYAIGFTGQRGVQLFYMVSAFTLCLSLDGERREEYPILNYFIRRFFRIAPLFYLAIVANVLLKQVAPTYSSLSGRGWSDVLLGFLFMNGLLPRAINSVIPGGWSIAVETTFYLFLPCLHRYFKTALHNLLLFVIAAPILGVFSLCLAAMTTDPVDEQFFAFLWFPVEFPVFVLGLLTYRIWKERFNGWTSGSDKRKLVSLLLVVSSFVIYLAVFPFNDLKLYFSSFLFLPLILGLSIHPWVLFVNRLTRFLGKISYSLYIVHSFVLSFITFALGKLDQYPSHLVSRYISHRPQGLVFVFLILLGLSVPVSFMTWKFLEQPGIRLGRRLVARREGVQRSSDAMPVP